MRAYSCTSPHVVTLLVQFTITLLDHVHSRSLLTITLVNNVTGSNLIECDQNVLKEMGIKKIGDRVRIFINIKLLRNKAIGNHRKRNRVRP